MMKRRNLLIITTVVIVALVLIASLIFLPKEETKYSIKIGNVPAITYAPTYVAISLFMDDVGINATYVAFPSGTKAREALITGEIDFASLSTVHVPIARLKDRPLKIIMSLHSREIFSLMVRSELKDTVKDVKDLKGLRLGFSAPGAGSWAFAVYLLKKAGLEPGKDVEMVAVGELSTMYSALKAGKVDAAMTWDPLTTQLIESGEAYALVDLYDPEQHAKLLGDEAMSQVLVTNENLISKNPGLVERVVRAHEMALEFIKKEDTRKVAEILQPYFKGMDITLLEKVLKRIKEAIPEDGSLSESAYYADLVPLIETGVLEKGVKFEEAVDWRFVGRRP
ncbi:MAG: ABC transporter substrate-binding protein [Nitrososphaerota archaeon]|nr:ABC transporter substrate-binding protein [Aigarchaeota archaeon]MDW8076476.1 ABC transporter substrate-binding protein [Nitrososphaerota archaeon]